MPFDNPACGGRMFDTPNRFRLFILAAVMTGGPSASADEPEFVPVEGQPLAANVHRVLQALEILGAPLDESQSDLLRAAARAQDARNLQQLLDAHVLCVVSI